MMHPKISSFYHLVINRGFTNVLSSEVLVLLKENGATSTEAAVLLHQGFDLPLDRIEDFIVKLSIWEPEDINEVAFQTMKYMFYNPDDPNYESDDDKVRLSI